MNIKKILLAVIILVSISGVTYYWYISNKYQGFTKYQIEGWTVYVDNRLIDVEPELGQEAMILMGQKMREIINVVPKRVLKDLQDIPIWLRAERSGTMEYHDNERWLEGQGRPTAMFRAVDINSAQDFIYSCRYQPACLLHELAHGYHHRILNFSDTSVLLSYNNAREKRLYESIENITGRSIKAYAMTDQKEYFAEMTEAYFLRNDFYPFLRNELAEHDPEMYKALQVIWRE